MDLRDYFHRRCSELLVMEREVWQLQRVMAQESGRADLKTLFEEQNAPKRQQISRLEQVVDELGGITGALEHPMAQAARRMYRQFMESNPPRALIDIQQALETDKLVDLTMASYRGLIALARRLGEETLVHLLRDNLETEKALRTRLDDLLPGVLNEDNEQLRPAA